MMNFRRFVCAAVLLLMADAAPGVSMQRMEGYPEGLSWKMREMIWALHSRVIPPRDTLKAEVDKVYGEPLQGLNGEHIYELLSHTELDQKRSEGFKGLNLNVVYENGKVLSARIGPDSVRENEQLHNGRYDYYTRLTDLLKIHDMRRKLLEDARWNQKRPNKSDANVASAVQPGTNSWDKSEFGMKFTIEGPYAFIADTTNAKKKTGSVWFMREGKGKRGAASFAPLQASDSPLDKITVEKEKHLAPLKNIKTESKKSITAGKTPAALIVFSYDEPGPKRDNRGSGYLVAADLNGIRYTIFVLNMKGNDPVEDKELGGIIKTLEITKAQ